MSTDWIIGFRGVLSSFLLVLCVASGLAETCVCLPESARPWSRQARLADVGGAPAWKLGFGAKADLVYAFDGVAGRVPVVTGADGISRRARVVRQDQTTGQTRVFISFPSPTNDVVITFPKTSAAPLEDFGGRGPAGAGTKDTAKIQGWIDAMAAKGGGRVIVPAGRHVVGEIELRDNIDLHLAEGCELVSSLDPLDFRDWATGDQGNASIIRATHVKNVKLTGKGKIDGQVMRFMYDDPSNGGAGEEHLTFDRWFIFRPHTVTFEDVRDFEISGVTLKDSASWTILLVGTDRGLVDGVRICNPLRAANTDAIDPDCCRNLTIRNCTIETGDDGVVVKTTSARAAKYGPSENIWVSNCVVKSTSSALKVGTETAADIRNVHFSDCRTYDSSQALAVYARDGGTVENVTFDNIVGTARRFTDAPRHRLGFKWWGSGEGIIVTAANRRGKTGEDCGRIRNVSFRNCDLTCESSATVVGRTNSVIENVAIENCRLHFVRQGSAPTGRFDEQPSDRPFAYRAFPALYARHVKGLVAKDVSVDYASDRHEAWTGTFEDTAGCADVVISGTCLAPYEDSVRSSVAEWPVLKTYEGAALRQVKLPLGGIGTGTISLSGRGGLVDWEVQNRPAKGYTPRTSDWPPVFNPSFVLRTETAEGEKAARLLEGPLYPDEYEGDMGCRAPNQGFPRFAKSVFKAAYPLGIVEMSDPKVPLEVRLEAMNPLVPHDSDASGIPAVLLRWRLRNPTDSPVKASVAATLVNFAGLVPGGNPHDPQVERTEDFVHTNGLVGVVMSGKNGGGVRHPSNGECAIFAPRAAGTVTAAADLREPGWGVAMDRAWTRLVAQGDIADTPKDDSTATVQTHLVQLCVSVELKPGEEREIPFVLAWRFPNRMKWHWDDANPKPEDCVGNWYATQYPTATAAADRLWSALPALEAETVAFVKGALDLPAPDVVKEAALFNLSTLRTETCFRTSDGHFFGWEGCADRFGSCFGSCTHVWGYEHCLVDLWPDLARSMLDNAFGVQLKENGHMRFRVQLPLAANTNDLGVACADGQMQTIVKAYEYWKKSGDDKWLARTGPAIRRALAFAWIEGGWDANRDGVMEGCQHNTMDVEYYGPNPQMEFLYLAALRASAEMADACGEAAFAADCRALVAKGSAWTEKNLFNGCYYEHRIVPPKGKVADGLRHPSMGAKDLFDPDFQLGAGCLVDQLVGDYAARVVGLGPVADENHARTALRTILEKCRKAPDDDAFNPMRSYALAGETSLKMAWYPENRMPRSPFPYYRETMTGFEYVVAANLAQRGLFAEAEKVVRDIRDRHDGIKRNPFDEAECGHHYVRALDAWNVLRAWIER